MSPLEPVEIEVPCAHVSEIKIREVKRPAAGCEDCLKMGGRWLHLRECLTCGRVGCCDSSPNRHATKHAHSSHHPILTSVEPGETWVWCATDNRMLAE